MPCRSTVKNADTIVVMAAGRIVEQGTHSELLTNPTGALPVQPLQCQRWPRGARMHITVLTQMCAPGRPGAAGAYSNLVKLQMQQAAEEGATEAEAEAVLQGGGAPLSPGHLPAR